MSYPKDYTNEEILEEIDRLTNSVNENQPMATMYYTKASLGFTELQRRNTRSFGKWSLGVSILAVLLAATAAFFSFRATQVSDQWQENQLKILHEIQEAILTKGA